MISEVYRCFEIKLLYIRGQRKTRKGLKHKEIGLKNFRIILGQRQLCGVIKNFQYNKR